MLCSSQFAAFRVVTLLGCFVPFSFSYFVSAYLSSDILSKEWHLYFVTHKQRILSRCKNRKVPFRQKESSSA